MAVEMLNSSRLRDWWLFSNGLRPTVAILREGDKKMAGVRSVIYDVITTGSLNKRVEYHISVPFSWASPQFYGAVLAIKFCPSKALWKPS